MPQSNVIIHRGPSPFDPERRLSCVLTGLPKGAPSRNIKTGPQPHLWVLDDDLKPSEAHATGQSLSFCGDCELANGGGCYVHWWRAPDRIWDGVQRDIYPYVGLEELKEIGRLRRPRLGAAGDPVAVPLGKLYILLHYAEAHTGFTRQWMKPQFQGYRHLLMASVFSCDERNLAWAMGWRTFRTTSAEAYELHPHERGCPASDEAGSVTTCFQCRGCSGLSHNRATGKIWGYVVISHGSTRGKHIVNRQLLEGNAVTPEGELVWVNATER